MDEDNTKKYKNKNNIINKNNNKIDLSKTIVKKDMINKTTKSLKMRDLSESRNRNDIKNRTQTKLSTLTDKLLESSKKNMNDMIDIESTNNTENKDPLDKQIVKHIYLLKSIFKDRPYTIMIQYPKNINEHRDCKDRVLKVRYSEKINLKYKIFEAHRYNCVLSNLKKACFKESKNEKFNVLWFTTCKPEFIRELQFYQRVNHFPNSWQLGRKDLM